MSKDATAKLGGFSLKWYMTRGINDAIADSTGFAKEIDQAVKRYIAGDWGDLGDEDKELTHADMYRLLTVDDISFITFEGWQGERGVFAWYYPNGVPHYMKIAEG